MSEFIKTRIATEQETKAIADAGEPIYDYIMAMEPNMGLQVMCYAFAVFCLQVQPPPGVTPLDIFEGFAASIRRSITANMEASHGKAG